MTVMYSFCFWYSVRLGAIIVAFTCMFQCLTALIACSYGMNDLKKTSSDIDYWVKTSDLHIMKSFFESMRDDPKTFLASFISVLSVYFTSCLLLIYAAFQCNTTFMYPFLILEFIRLVILCIVLIFGLMTIKGNTMNLGIVIGSSIFGTFTLLYMWYQWFCTFSLWQIIREIESLNRQYPKSNPIISTIHGNVSKRWNYNNSPFYLPQVSN